MVATADLPTEDPDKKKKLYITYFRIIVKVCVNSKMQMMTLDYV